MRRNRRRRQRQRQIFRIVNLVDRVDVRIVAMEVRLRRLRIDRRRHAKRQCTSVARSDALRQLVHEELRLPAIRHIDRELLDQHRRGAAVMQRRAQDERLARGDHRSQHIALIGRETLLPSAARQECPDQAADPFPTPDSPLRQTDVLWCEAGQQIGLLCSWQRRRFNTA